MGFNSIMKVFMPKDQVFYSIFEEVADNVYGMGKALKAVVSETDFDEREELIAGLENQEHINDELTHQIYTELGRNFITPFDREDIHRLASSIDDVLDLIKAAGDRVILYNITQAPSAAGQLAHLILRQTEELGKAVSSLQKNGQVLSHCVEINRLENEADEISQTAIGYLFDTEIDPINLIRIKELMEVLERATDKAEDAADVLESVVLKNT